MSTSEISSILKSGGLLSGKHLYISSPDRATFTLATAPHYLERDGCTSILPVPSAPHGPLSGHRFPLHHNALCHIAASRVSSICPTDFDFEWDLTADNTILASVEPYENDLTQQQTSRLQKILDEYREQGLFSRHDTDLGLLIPEIAEKLPFRINVTVEFRHNISPYRMSEAEQVWFDDTVPELEAADVVEPALYADGNPSPYASSPRIINKTEVDSFRFTVDFREVNAHTKRDAHPLPDPSNS